MQKKLVEAALFMSPKPLDLNDLGKIAGINSLGYLKDLLEQLQKDYEGRGLEVVKTSEGWHMQVRQDLLEKVSHLTPYSDLPEGCKRTLALIVYKEPVKQAEIIKIQGNKAYAYIKQLDKRGLVKTEKQGHSKILKVTREFENYFGQEKDAVREAMEKEFSGLNGEPEVEKTPINVPEKTEKSTKEKDPRLKKKKPKKEETKLLDNSNLEELNL